MSKILVTGASGFIDGVLESKLRELEYEVLDLDSKNVDMTLKDSLFRYYSDNIQHIFHLAARTFVPDN